MRRMSHLSLHLSIAFAATGFMAPSVYAQDLGTYRPGQAYQSVASPGADVCNSHCAGDAQCQAWNYVKVSPKASGVCEFLAKASEPVQSPISISGLNLSQKQYARTVNQGSTHTIRVGTATPAKAVPEVTRSVPQSRSQRRVVREAVSQRVAPQLTGNRRAQQRRQQVARPSTLGQPQARQTFPTPQAPRQAIAPQTRPVRIGQPQVQLQSQYAQPQAVQSQKPQFKPFLDGAAQAVVPRQNQQAYSPQNYQGQNYQTQNHQAQNHQDQAYQQARHVQPRAQNRTQRRRQVGGRQPIGQPITAPTNGLNVQRTQTAQASHAPQLRPSTYLPRASANAPVTQENAQAAFARRQADLAAIASGNSADPIQKSLYGSLNDDVKVPTALTQLPEDPNAPIATSASRIVVPVQTEALGQAIDSQLAGGPK